MLEPLATAFLLGLLSSLHCGGMCGGISGALSLSLPDHVKQSPLRMFGYQSLFNIGRIASYSLAGATIGLLTLALPEQSFATGFAVARVAVGALMILLALHLTGIFRSMSAIEKVGLGLWRKLTPLYRPLLPARKPHQAVALGMIWGWLPCGLVYTALAYSLTVPGTGASAAVMAAFGLGTLPALLLAGTGFNALMRRLPATRPLMGVTLGLLGIWTMAAALPLGGHDHSAAHAQHPATTESLKQAPSQGHTHSHSH